MRAKQNLANEAIYESYINGRIQAELEGFAKCSPLSYEQLAYSVGNFLLGTAQRSILGTPNSMPALSGKTAKGNKTPRKMAVVKRAYRKRSPQASSKQKTYWAKMTLAERSAEVARRMAKRYANKKAA